MASLTSRGRTAVVVAFLASAALLASAAVVLVQVSKQDRTPGTALPSGAPTLLFPSGSPTASPDAAPTVPSAPSSLPTATSSPATAATSNPNPGVPVSTRSPAPRPPAPKPPAPSPTPQPEPLSASAGFNPASGGDTDDTYSLTIRATDGKGTISLDRVAWGDGTNDDNLTGVRCTATVGGDCRTYELTHRYDEPGDYQIVIDISSGIERVRLRIDFTVDAPPAP